MVRKTKTGSSRRKGDEYQDLTALQLALELYIDGTDFELFIEYEKAGSFDDVLIVRQDLVDGYQIKHAVSDHSVYVTTDLTDGSSVVYLEKFAKSWVRLKSEFPGRTHSLHLRTNRGLDAQLGTLVDSTGYFDEMFVQNRYRKDKRKLRSDVRDATGLSEDDFREFIQCFHFDTNHPSWKPLAHQIKADLLDHRLGISDRRIFADLKQLIEHHAIDVSDPITPLLLDNFFRNTQSRYLLPQVFPVDKQHFVEPPSLSEKLDSQLAARTSGYVVVTGPPGSGKSTALTAYFERLEVKESAKFVVVRYYCFVRVHDNRQRRRLEAQSLRVNLLTELQRMFPSVAEQRRFDFGEDKFVEALEAVGSACRELEQHLVILLDGLDHVERDAELRDSVIDSLPKDLPAGIIIVIGTQELRNWKPLALRKGRMEHHVSMPLFSLKETRLYVVERCGLDLSDRAVSRIHDKSGGLPLYLRYLVTSVASSEDPESAIESFPAAIDGNIRTYYEMLWSAFDVDGSGDAKYLSAVLCSLRFSVHEDEVFGFQRGIGRPRFDEAFRRVRHLLRIEGNLVRVFHSSFRVFVLADLAEDARQEFATNILVCLNGEALQSSRWFAHAFQYALDARDYDYLLNSVNRTFVDAALIRYRDVDDILDAIDCAIEAAGTTGDLVALARLGSLKYRTSVRLEEFSWADVSEALLYRGHCDQVVDSVYAEETGEIVSNPDYALTIILLLNDAGKTDLAGKLFDRLCQSFRGGNTLGKRATIDLARCAGIFRTDLSRTIHWMAEIRLHQNSLEAAETAPEYAPHLAAYIDELVCAGHERVWKAVKELHKPFSNRLLRHLIIRAVARHRPADILRSEVVEYAESHPESKNVELAFLAAKAALPAADVTRLAGRFDLPTEHATHHFGRVELENQLRHLAHWAVIFSYEQKNNALAPLRSRLVGSATVWGCVQRHLLIVGHLVGTDFTNREMDWFNAAERSVKELECAAEVAGERTPDALSAGRAIFPQSLSWISEVLLRRCPERLDDWIALLRRLRHSFVWTAHYGFSERIANFAFEFPVWESQAVFPEIRGRLQSLLADCANSYSSAVSLKGALRGQHFLRIAALAAKCGFRSSSDEWAQRGVVASLAYGYRKDITLQNLIDVVRLLDRYSPEGTLSRCAAILEMIKWMPNVTDGRETQHFAQHLLPTVAQNSRAAALELLREYYECFSRWQANESLGKYLAARDDGDAEFLWALASVLDPNESVSVRQHIVDIGSRAPTDSTHSWKARLAHYFKVMANPRHWTIDVWETSTDLQMRADRTRHADKSQASESRLYELDGNSISVEEAKNRCMASFADMVGTIQKLKEQNDAVFPYSLTRAALPRHIASARSSDELDGIRQFLDEHIEIGGDRVIEQIGRRYLDLGDCSNGLNCLEEAIRAGQWYSFRDDTISGPLATLIEYDKVRARRYFVEQLQENLTGRDDRGFGAPLAVATACDALGESENLRQVFDDYLLHCEELFGQLPDEKWFDELPKWRTLVADEETQIVNLLIDRLAYPPTAAGDRVVRALVELVRHRGDDVVPIIFNRSASAGGLQLWRLLAVIQCIAATNRDKVRQHCHVLTDFLSSNDVLVRLSVSRSLDSAFEDKDTPKEIAELLRQVGRDYSSIIAYRGFGFIHVEPTGEFVELTNIAARGPFRRQLEAACEILALDLDAVTAHLERRVLETGVTLDEARDKAKSMWSDFSHPQGWPVIGFVSEFQIMVSELLYQTLDEVLIKCRYHPEDLEALWRVVQCADPEYCDFKFLPMPSDIHPLVVDDKDEWLSEGDGDLCVAIEEVLPNTWATIFEFRQLAQESAHHVEYVSWSHVRACLVRPEAIDKLTEVQPEAWGEVVVTHHPAENLTYAQFRDALLSGQRSEPNGNLPVRPLVAFKEMHVGFQGFHTIASFSSTVIREFGLRFDGVEVFYGDQAVGRFEAWQEGFLDAECQDEPLSFGVRFTVNPEFLKKVCETAKCAVAVWTVENRFVMGRYEPEPTENQRMSVIRVWPTSMTAD